MPYRIGWSPDAGTLTVITETATEAVEVIRQHKASGRETFLIADLDHNDLTFSDLERVAAEESRLAPSA